MAGRDRGKGGESRSTRAAGFSIAAEKGKMGKTFVSKEERQLCCSVLDVLQDHVVGMVNVVLHFGNAYTSIMIRISRVDLNHHKI